MKLKLPHSVVAVLALHTPLFASASITALSPTQGRNNSNAIAVTADGSVVVGFSGGFPTRHATRWAGPSWAAQDLGTAVGQTDGILYGVADGGTAAVGWAQVGTNYVPFRWTSQAGVQNLNVPPDWRYTGVRAISPDGAFIVGQSLRGTVEIAVRWNGTDSPIALPVPQMISSARARVVTRSGNILGSGEGAGGPKLIRWSGNGNNFTAIASFPGRQPLYPAAASADESVIAGVELSPNIPTVSTPWRWTAEGGYQSLPLIAGFVSGSVHGMSGNGAIIVGDVFGENYTNYHGAIWTNAGVQTVESYLSGFGVDMTGWNITTCHGISQDGNTLVGVGIDPSGVSRGWVAVVPAPAPLSLVLLYGFAVMRRRQ